MIENVSTQLTVFHCFAHCLLPRRAFASLYALLFLEKEAEIGGRASVNCSFRKSIFTTNTFQGIQYFNSFSISVVLDFYIRSLFNGSERGHCASNTSARRDVTIDDVIIRTPDVMCEWLTRRTRYIPNFICLACKLIAL